MYKSLGQVCVHQQMYAHLSDLLCYNTFAALFPLILGVKVLHIYLYKYYVHACLLGCTQTFNQGC